MNTAKEHTVCDCGHAPTAPAGVGTGYGLDAHGFSRCHDCSNTHELALFKTAGDERKPYTAYLTQDPHTGSLTVTTWPGGELAKVISTHTVRLTRTSFTHGKTMLSYTARDAHGRLWYGRGSAGIVTTLRRKGA